MEITESIPNELSTKELSSKRFADLEQIVHAHWKKKEILARVQEVIALRNGNKRLPWLRGRLQQRIEWLDRREAYEEDSNLLLSQEPWTYIQLGLSSLTITDVEGKSAYQFLYKLDDLLLGSVIDATGIAPYDERVIEGLIFLQNGIFGGKNIWRNSQTIVIGRQNFDKEYLQRSIVVQQTQNITLQFMSQEDFVENIVKLTFTPYYEGDPRIVDHPGLSYLASIGFKWPSTDASPGMGSGLSQEYDYDDHPLSSIHRYNVRKGTSIESRHYALTHAVADKHPKLGLKNVAFHIAGLVKWRKMQRNDNFADAIDRWEEDLEWLRCKYYIGKSYSFEWPKTEA